MKPIIKLLAGPNRAKAFHTIDTLLPKAIGNVVETGCIRTWPDSPDGASTVILAKLAKDHGRRFDSIDKNIDHVKTARRALGDHWIQDQFMLHVGDSVAFLRQYTESIGCLYLDSMDYLPEEPHLSANHALMELQMAWSHLSDACIIGIDDILPDTLGKGGKVIPILLEQGFKLRQGGYTHVYTRGL